MDLSRGGSRLGRITKKRDFAPTLYLSSVALYEVQGSNPGENRDETAKSAYLRSTGTDGC